MTALSVNLSQTKSKDSVAINSLTTETLVGYQSSQGYKYLLSAYGEGTVAFLPLRAFSAGQWDATALHTNKQVVRWVKLQASQAWVFSDQEEALLWLME